MPEAYRARATILLSGNRIRKRNVRNWTPSGTAPVWASFDTANSSGVSNVFKTYSG
ncbi:MAG: hypothetical protein FWD23_02715 [Oscillospiraceae bacterium]|nr:hypothetical protein [Oscillospiraceae bacterium]